MSHGDWEGLLVGLGFVVMVGVLVAVIVLREGARTRRNSRVWSEVAKRLGLVASRNGVSGTWQHVEVYAEYRRGEIVVRAKQSVQVAGSIVGSSGKVHIFEAGPPRVVDAVRQIMAEARDWDVGFHDSELTLSRKTLTVDLGISDTIRLAAKASAQIDVRQSYREA